MRVSAIRAAFTVAVIAAASLAALELTHGPIDDAALRSIWREDLSWNAANLRFEAARLGLALAELAREPSEAHRDAVSLRVDVLWSRLALMDGGAVGDYLRALDTTGLQRALTNVLERWDRQVAATGAGGEPDAAALRREVSTLLPDLQAYAAAVADFDETRFVGIHDAVNRHNRLSLLIALGALALVALLAIGAAAQIRDAAARLRAQRLQTRRAERAARARSRFLTMMSHELRTPMNGVIGLLSLVDRGTLAPGQTRLVDTAAQSAATMARLLDDLLDLSDLETTATSPQVETTSVAALAARLRTAAGGRWRGGACVLEAGVDDRRPVRVATGCLEKLVAQMALHLDAGAEAGPLSLRLRLEDATLTLSLAAPMREAALTEAGALFATASDGAEIETDRLGPLLVRTLLQRSGAHGRATVAADGALRLTVRWPAAPAPSARRDNPPLRLAG